MGLPMRRFFRDVFFGLSCNGILEGIAITHTPWPEVMCAVGLPAASNRNASAYRCLSAPRCIK